MAQETSTPNDTAQEVVALSDVARDADIPYDRHWRALNRGLLGPSTKRGGTLYVRRQGVEAYLRDLDSAGLVGAQPTTRVVVMPEGLRDITAEARRFHSAQIAAQDVLEGLAADRLAAIEAGDETRASVTAKVLDLLPRATYTRVSDGTWTVAFPGSGHTARAAITITGRENS